MRGWSFVGHDEMKVATDDGPNGFGDVAGDGENDP